MTTLDPRIGQRFLVGFHGLVAPDYILEWLGAGRIAGVILFARNVESPQQLADLTRSLHAASNEPILIAIDQEGGMVARMRAQQGFTESPGAMALAAAQDAPDRTQAVSRLLADEMRAVGINWTFAPVVDLSYNADNPTVGTRSFGRDPQRVGQLAAQAVTGFQSGGVIACAKHFPGLGNTSIDSHLDLPTLSTPLAELLSGDLEPYRHVVDADIASIMTTHTIYEALDAEHPATLSPAAIQQLLRQELAYKGVVVTDCLEMQAITKHYGEGESAVLGILAGVDIMLISHTRSHQEAAFAAVDAAVQGGRIAEANLDAAHERVQALRTQYALTLDEIDPSHVASTQHQAIALDAAKAGISLTGTLPTLTDKRVGVIEFAAQVDSAVMDENDLTSFINALATHLPNATTSTLNTLQPTDAQIAQAQSLAESVDVLIVATRNAHIVSQQRERAAQLLSTAPESVLVVLRNPYDADLLSAATTLCTFGDSVPSLNAAALALSGAYQPTGQRPALAEV